MSSNEFDCLTNQLLQIGLRIGLPVAHGVPARVREMLGSTDVGDVCAVAIHQCPKAKGITNYRLEVHTKKGLVRLESFDSDKGNKKTGHDTFLLYDRYRDGVMKHMHLVH